MTRLDTEGIGPYDPCPYADCGETGPHRTCRGARGVIVREIRYDAATGGFVVPGWLTEAIYRDLSRTASLRYLEDRS
jgi:hypothetical protein